MYTNHLNFNHSLNLSNPNNYYPNHNHIQSNLINSNTQNLPFSDFQQNNHYSFPNQNNQQQPL